MNERTALTYFAGSECNLRPIDPMWTLTSKASINAQQIYASLVAMALCGQQNKRLDFQQHRFAVMIFLDIPEDSSDRMHGRTHGLVLHVFRPVVA